MKKKSQNLLKRKKHETCTQRNKILCLKKFLSKWKLKASFNCPNVRIWKTQGTNTNASLINETAKYSPLFHLTRRNERHGTYE